jgi:hypothetical protein
VPPILGPPGHILSIGVLTQAPMIVGAGELSATVAGPAGCFVCAGLPADSTGGPGIPEIALQDDRETLDRICGALLGVAIGDGIGDPARHGPLIDVLPVPEPGSIWIGGATQTTLFTVEGMVRMLVRLNIRGIGPGFAVLRHALDRWLFTQHPADAELVRRRGEWGNRGRWPDGWLVRQHVLHHRRTRMATTVAALNIGRDVELTERRALAWAPTSSAGAGGLVRVGPAGALVYPAFSFEMGVRIAAQTHGSPDGYLPAGAVSRVVAGLVAGDAIADALEEADRELAGWPDGEATRVALAGGVLPEWSPRSALGALGRAVRYSLDSGSEDVVGRIAQAARDGGTAPAVVTGLLLGAARGASALDPGWRAAPEVAPIIRELAEAAWLVHRQWVEGRPIPGLQIDIGPDDGDYLAQVLWPRYPGW